MLSSLKLLRTKVGLRTVGLSGRTGFGCMERKIPASQWPKGDDSCFRKGDPQGHSPGRCDRPKVIRDLGSSAIFNMFPYSPGWLPKFLPSSPVSKKQNAKEKKGAPPGHVDFPSVPHPASHSLAHPATWEAGKGHLSAEQQ